MSEHSTLSFDTRLGFLGAGSIVEAMLAGILKNELIAPERIFVANRSDQARLRHLAETFGVNACEDKAALVEQSDILILAMKPKDAPDACRSLRGLVRPDQLVISVVAGVSTACISDWLGTNGPIVRTMPNTSSAVGLSVTGLSANHAVSEQQLGSATALFEAIGSVHIVSEDELDIITGLSGSGPAYVYYLAEAMEGAGAKAGLSREMARQLTVQTLLGAAQMLLHSSDEPALLRKKVTSPGGTTQAGLEVLDSYRFQHAVTSAVLRAAERARELGAQYR
ncbi:pyrroline-5-carboxylate reductase [Brevibacillus sp. NL20B1]|jgi:pyrroline-5-carboxylate reductase|uniref:pyrroline-5-carboxylate reductase n=1 Tax=Brevibacillus sp. NL20B1 TaxID=2829799 RepID=UPI001B97D6D2|nr:pyrroline-5-carboxylate reductase [Brevibacillus sp. NL20B1]MBR8660520.1 pyrroline-5-carboxylate reductase [Brevibacillus sp. NL20B1]